jgi:hypothetical protein
MATPARAHRSLSILIGLLLASPGCERASRTSAAVPASTGAEPAAIRLVDVTASSGIAFRHQSGRSGRFYLPETMGAGCAFLDYDNDGRLDLFLVNSSRLPGFTGKGPFYPALYRQKPDGTFEDVTRAAGLQVDGYGIGCAVGDIDNDGGPDLYLTAMGPNFLFRNNGDGTFSDVTRRAGVGDPRFSSSAAFLDYDRDGHLDLFVCNYCVWSPETNVVIQDASGRKHMAGPRRYKGAPSTLYRNRGDGTFEDVTRRAGVFSPIGKSLGVLVLDVDEDAWPDLLVANDLEPNLLYRNNRDGTFREIGVEAGVAYSNTGQARAGMGVDSADIANDGREAIVIGNNSTEGLALFQPAARAGTPGTVSFTDVADPAGIFAPSLPFLTFGALFVDLDNDGLKDLFAANGHIDEGIQSSQPKTTFAERPLLFRNLGAGRFAEVGSAAGAALQEPMVARGLAAGDYDRDGDVDLLVSACNGRPKLLRNETAAAIDPSPRPPPRSGEGEPRKSPFGSPLSASGRGVRGEGSTHSRPHWLAIRTRGTKSNRSGIGTRVIVEAGGTRQQGWIRSGSSYASASDLAAWFGLGARSKVERMTLRWPSGAVRTLTNVTVDREILVEEP